jgi:hypothetical protein
LELKGRLIAETQSRRATGKTLEAIGEELGVPWKTLSRWCTEEQKSASGFRAVEIVATPSAKLVVHGPAGLRIEGFDLDGVVELLRRLG